jgi:transposase-like protein
VKKVATFEELEDLVSTEALAIEFFERFRWGKNFCPHCGSHWRYSTRKDGIYKCASCRLRYSVQTGTIFQNSKVPLRTWLLAIWHVVHQKGIASTELAERLGVTQKTAWLMLDRLYQASRTLSFKTAQIDDEECDFHVVKTINELSQSTFGFDRPSDVRRADRFIGRLYEQKPYTDPAKVRRWAMRKGWDFDSALELESIARMTHRAWPS